MTTACVLEAPMRRTIISTDMCRLPLSWPLAYQITSTSFGLARHPRSRYRRFYLPRRRADRAWMIPVPLSGSGSQRAHLCKLRLRAVRIFRITAAARPVFRPVQWPEFFPLRTTSGIVEAIQRPPQRGGINADHIRAATARPLPSSISRRARSSFSGVIDGGRPRRLPRRRAACIPAFLHRD